MTDDQISARLRDLGIPDDSTARRGDEPAFVHIRDNGRPWKWYSTAPVGIIALKSDLRARASSPRSGRLTIELGKAG